jgi:hypothetical protein
MNTVRASRLLTLAGLVSLFAFAGDIVADSIADLQGNHCACASSHSDSDHEKTPCSHCSCAVHNGNVIASTAAVNLSGVPGRSLFFLTSKQSTPISLPAAIDHPPQLA